MTPPGLTFRPEEEMTSPSKNMAANALYARSKLAILLFVKYGLVERVIRPNGYRIFALATHPGAIHTEQQDQFKETYGKLFGSMFKHVTIPSMRSPEHGSLSTLWASTSEDVEKRALQGRYIVEPGILGDESAQACDEKLGESLWELSESTIRSRLGDDGLLSWSL